MMMADLAVNLGWGDVLIVLALCVVVALAMRRL
jgi:hypothetical protein